ncbi:hypothetical protein, partial [Armatimonas sp.]|uniref:hypothetical protein n=1 Tax=Armatimonas sp. TaxID=1872638 RepID=UPI00286A9073
MAVDDLTVSNFPANCAFSSNFYANLPRVDARLIESRYLARLHNQANPRHKEDKITMRLSTLGITF